MSEAPKEPNDELEALDDQGPDDARTPEVEQDLPSRHGFAGSVKTGSGFSSVTRGIDASLRVWLPANLFKLPKFTLPANIVKFPDLTVPSRYLDIPKLDIPASYFGNLSNVVESLNKSLYGSMGLDRIFEQTIRPLIESLGSFGSGLRGLWPANLSGVRLTIEQAEMLTLEEGLPIAWVPNQATIKLILEADSPAARRAIYGRRWRGITNDCEVLLEKFDSVATRNYTRFLRAVIAALRAGHSEAAQALATTTLDTAVKEFFNKKTYQTWISNREKIDPDELPVRTFFVYCQLWGLHRHFESKDDPIPGTFNRHASVHAVSYRQYSRLNAVLALAHLTSLLWAIDTAYGSRSSSRRNARRSNSE